MNIQNTPRKTDISFVYILLSGCTLLGALLYAICFFNGLFTLSFLLLAVCSASFSVLLLSTRNALPFLAIPAVCVITYFITSGSVSAVILSLAFAAVGACIALSIRKRGTKVSCVLICACVFAVFTVIFAIFAFTLSGHELTVDAIKTFIGDIKAQTTATLSELLDMLYSMYEQYGIKVSPEDRISAESLYLTFSVMIPGFFIMCLTVLSYIAVTLSALFIRTSHLEILLPDPRYRLNPTSISAYVFFGTYALMIISTWISSLTALYVVSLNLALIFTPPMIVCGVRGLVDKTKNPVTRRYSMTVIILCAVGLLLNVLLPAVLLGFIGARNVTAYNKSIAVGKHDETGTENK